MNKKLIMLMLPLVIAGCTVGGSNNSSVPSVDTSINVKTYNISIVENPNCKISTSKEKASRNEVIEVYVTDIRSGYEVTKITVNGRKIDNAKFIMPNEDVVIEVLLKNVNNTDGINSVTVAESEYALIWVDKESYNLGDTVNIDYKCKGKYVLDFFSVNGNPIEGTSFKMIDDDVLIEGTFKLAIEDTDWQVRSSSGGWTATSYWYFNYGEEGLEIKVKVDDRILCGEAYKEQAYNRDNVEMIFRTKSDYRGWEMNETYKILISIDNTCSFQTPRSGTAWGDPIRDLHPDDFNYNVERKSLENKDGYNGYEVNIFFSYALIDLEREDAVDNISICPAMRNTNSHNVTDWRCINLDGVVWEDASTHPILLENGSYQERG